MLNFSNIIRNEKTQFIYLHKFLNRLSSALDEHKNRKDVSAPKIDSTIKTVSFEFISLALFPAIKSKRNSLPREEASEEENKKIELKSLWLSMKGLRNKSSSSSRESSMEKRLDIIINSRVGIYGEWKFIGN